MSAVSPDDPVLWACFESFPLFTRSIWADCASCNSPETALIPEAVRAGEPAISCQTCGEITEGQGR